MPLRHQLYHPYRSDLNVVVPHKLLLVELGVNVSVGGRPIQLLEDGRHFVQVLLLLLNLKLVCLYPYDEMNHTATLELAKLEMEVVKNSSQAIT